MSCKRRWVIVNSTFLQRPQNGRTREPAYSQALVQNKIDRQRVIHADSRTAMVDGVWSWDGREVCRRGQNRISWRGVFLVWSERTVGIHVCTVRKTIQGIEHYWELSSCAAIRLYSFIHCRHLYSASSSGATQKRSQPQRGRIMLF